MAFYYVKNGGTATGDAGRVTSARTGTFAAMGASAYYDSIKDVIVPTIVPSTAAVAGDIICVSSAHDFVITSTTTYSIPDGVVVMCVDDANAENKSTGAKEGYTGTTYTAYIGSVANGLGCLVGIEIRGGQNTGNAVTSDQTFVLEDVLFTQNMSSGLIRLVNGKGNVIILRDSAGKWGAAGTAGAFYLNQTGHCEIRGQRTSAGFIDSAGTAQAIVLRTVGNLSPVIIRCADISNATDIVSAGTSSDAPQYTFARTKTPASAVLSVADADAGMMMDYQGFGESGISDDDYWNFHTRYWNFGVIDADTSIYRDLGANVDAIQKVTALMQAEAQVLPYFAPLRFKLAELKLDLTSAVTITVELAQWDDGNGAPTRLKDDEFWLEIERPDSTDLALGVIDTTRPTTYDISATQADLTTSTAVWKKGSDDSTISADITKSKVSHTFSTITGATNAHVTVWACLAKDLSAVGDVNVDLLVDES